MAEFTHFDLQGNAAMVDVSGKEQTVRRASATGSIKMCIECFEAVRQGSIKKGDVLGAARIAGIMAVKQTAFLIPLCHTLLIQQASVDFSFNEAEHSVNAICSVTTTWVTGAEMEALTGVSIALLTVYDMCKAIDKGMEIDRIFLLEKSGGKSGTYSAGRVKIHTGES